MLKGHVLKNEELVEENDPHGEKELRKESEKDKNQLPDLHVDELQEKLVLEKSNVLPINVKPILERTEPG